MRKLILYLLTTAVVIFYGGVAAIAGGPYLGAVRDFVQNATSALPVGNIIFSNRVKGHSSQGITTTVPFTGSVQLRRQLAAAVQHLTTSGTVSSQRTNILLLGSDNDQKFASYAAPLTQVIIILSIDPVSRTVTLISIPRDFWVHIPNYRYNIGPDGSVGWSKIDVASKLGFNSTACTVEYNFGVPIDHWVWVGLDGFIKVIDTLQGVTLNVPHPVVDDTYPDDLSGNPYAYRRVYIPPGPQRLDGDTALRFVRSRHGDAQGDFGRSGRQQQLLTRVRQSLQSQDAASLVALLPSLLGDFNGKVRTDIPADVQTGASYLSLLRSASNYKVTQLILQPPFSQAGYQALDNDPQVEAETGLYPTAESAVLPNWPLIDTKIAEIFGAQSRIHPHCTTPNTTGKP